MANQDWQRKVAEWLRGRQGPDDIVIFCTNLAFVLVVINLFARTVWLGWVALALIAAWGLVSLPVQAYEKDKTYCRLTDFISYTLYCSCSKLINC